MSHLCVLVADDEEAVVSVLQRSLTRLGYQVLTAFDGEEALTVASRFQPDIVVLDVSMPRLDGLEVCGQLRRDSELADAPVLFLSGRDAIKDRVAGLDCGGDDYLCKPFDLRELEARIAALLRRSRRERRLERGADSLHSSLRTWPLKLEPNTCRVSVGRMVAERLTPTERDLLEYLMRHPGEVHSSQKLLQEVWGYPPGTADPGLVRWHVRNLRSKIEPDPAHPTVIRTLPRLGYVLSTDGSV